MANIVRNDDVILKKETKRENLYDLRKPVQIKFLICCSC